MNCKQLNTIEDFICNKEFTLFVQQDRYEEINSIIQTYPEKKHIISEAILLIRHLNVEEYTISEQQIESDLEALLIKINKRHRSMFRIWISSAAACIAVIFAAYYFYTGNIKQEDAFAVLDAIETNTDEIVIISGKSQTSIENNSTIEQTPSGDLLLSKKERIESDKINTEFLQLVVPNGKRASIKFNDGTVAWLNSGTKLVYPKLFSDKSRDIYIDGEVFLEVARNESQPFQVHTKSFEVVVLGTQFNISSYQNEETSSVVLVSGSVKIISDNKKGGTLTPNQGYFVSNGKEEVKNVDVYNYICWKYGIMKVEDESLALIFQRLSRYYNVDIKYDSKIANEIYKGKINLNNSLEEVLLSISLSTPFTYVKTNDSIIIK